MGRTNRRRPAIDHHPDALDQLLYAITPTHAGTVRIAGAHVEYADGIRTGSRDPGMTVIVRVR